MLLSKRVALAVAGVAAAAVVGTAGVAAATAPGPSGSPAPSPSASAPEPGSQAPGRAGERKGKGKHRLFGRGMHGEFVVKGKDGKPVTLLTVRGEVTAVGATSITIKAEDGFTATYAINAETKVRGKGAEKIADVKVGDTGAAVATKSPTPTARTILIRK